MKGLHFATIALLVIAYLVGARWPGAAKRIGLA